MLDQIIYQQNEEQIITDLLPPPKRTLTTIAWLTALLSCVQYLHDLVFDRYLNGSTYANWSAGAYVYLERVKDSDKAIYECINVNGVTGSTRPLADNVNWKKVVDTFIGLNERLSYNAQLIKLEYALNRHFEVAPTGLPWLGASQVTQIYIIRNAVNNRGFWMAQNSQGEPNSYMSQSSKNAISWMPISATTFAGNYFTIYVPSATYSAIQATIPAVSISTADDVIRAIADKYVRAGKKYIIIQY